MEIAGQDDDSSKAQGVRVVDRVIDTLRILASGQDRGVRLTDVVTQTGLSRPTAHRILQALIKGGAAEQDEHTRRYLIGTEMMLMGFARVKFPICVAAEPYLLQLAEELGDTVFLTIRSGCDSVCVDRKIGSYPVKVMSIDVGARRPLGAGVAGVVLLAALPDETVTDICAMNEPRLRQFNLDGSAILERVGETRSRGYAFVPMGVMPGTRALAVPVRNASGATIAAISMTSIAERLPPESVERVVALLAKKATLVARRLDQMESARSSRRAPSSRKKVQPAE